MPGTEESQREGRAVDPDVLAKALEAELILKRAAWQRAAVRRGPRRAFSYLFLCVVLLGALFVYFYLLPNLGHRAAESPGAKAAESTR